MITILNRVVLEKGGENVSVMIVGGDYLGNIEKKLYSLGVTELLHVNGRKGASCARLKMPERVAMILVLTDFVNHNLAKIVKEQAKDRGIPAFFAKRSLGALAQSGFERQLVAAVK